MLRKPKKNLKLLTKSPSITACHLSSLPTNKKSYKLVCKAALKLLDDASAAIQYSRTLLQHGLDHTRQGVTVFDQELRLMCWNRAFQDLFDLPTDLVRFGVGLDEIVSYNAF